MNYNELYKNLLEKNYVKCGEDVDVCIEIQDKTMFIYFLGSNSKIDWKNNFRFWGKVYKKQQNPLLVHKGYARAYKSCNDELMEKILLISLINNYDIKDLTFYFVGHSFGGAMAILASEDFYFRYKVKPNLITFGSPKVLFSKKSKDYIRNCIVDVFQFAHINDIVTKVPPFYEHVNLIKFGKFKLFGLFNPCKYHLSYGDM